MVTKLENTKFRLVCSLLLRMLVIPILVGKKSTRHGLVARENEGLGEGRSSHSLHLLSKGVILWAGGGHHHAESESE